MEALKLPQVEEKTSLRLINSCGCGKPAQYLVYEQQKEHCHSCMMEAINCDVPVLVRML